MEISVFKILSQNKLLFFFLLLTCVVLSILANSSGDETIYLSSATSAARGLLVYRDFPYFQGPLLPYIYGIFASFGLYELWHFRMVTAIFLFFSIVIGMRIIIEIFEQHRINRRNEAYILYTFPLFCFLSINSMAMSTRLGTKEAVASFFLVNSIYFLVKSKFKLLDGIFSIFFTAVLFGVKLTYLNIFLWIVGLNLFRLFLEGMLSLRNFILYTFSAASCALLMYIPAFMAFDYFNVQAIKHVVDSYSNFTLFSYIKYAIRDIPEFVVNQLLQILFAISLFTYGIFNIKNVTRVFRDKNLLKRYFPLVVFITLFLSQFFSIIFIQRTTHNHRLNILYPVLTLLAAYVFLYFKFYYFDKGIINRKLKVSFITALIIIAVFFQMHNIYGLQGSNWNSYWGNFLRPGIEYKEVKRYLTDYKGTKPILAIGFENIANSLNMNLTRGSGSGLACYNFDLPLDESLKYRILNKGLLKYYFQNRVCGLIILDKGYYNQLKENGFLEEFKYKTEIIGKGAVRIILE